MGKIKFRIRYQELPLFCSSLGTVNKAIESRDTRPRGCILKCKHADKAACDFSCKLYKQATNTQRTNESQPCSENWDSWDVESGPGFGSALSCSCTSVTQTTLWPYLMSNPRPKILAILFSAILRNNQQTSQLISEEELERPGSISYLLPFAESLQLLYKNFLPRTSKR